MSARHWPFAALTEADVAQARVAAEAARLGLRLEWGMPPERGAMLRFDASGPFGTLQLVVAADDWCPQMLPALEGLAWSELVDRDTLGRWLPDARLLDFADVVLAGSQVTLRDVLPASLMARTRQPQPRLITAQGPAWIEQADVVPHLRATDAALDLCVPVELEVARLTLPLPRLRSLAPGSVLLLEQFQPIARHRAQRLYTFDFTLETVSVNTPFDFPDDETDTVGYDSLPATGAPALAPPGLDVARLPVTVEVVLCQLQQRVGDLAALQPGTVFNLPPDAWTQLQLRVNGQTIARGELVQVGEQLGVQLHQAPVLS
ncbi:type III secretion system cytoplasmic ring protein SctQ [Stenotrophomonas oahuensis]|uniref:Type III secretion system cytoplasmic ring protein SctQ n=1 Tax=Stenotrophomonas oahuensis TaxID=3003271 RepID=A0ABY9YPY9_9GAMM|nr:type III secretion system cytoplasmic ring protein SctQ [Stenotrophomonas sp. A5586]WNH52963.1 type III secretion system cytoplasmic ring protein SctQ [Stenotrophomonas sp. A5586]